MNLNNKQILKVSCNTKQTCHHGRCNQKIFQVEEKGKTQRSVFDRNMGYINEIAQLVPVHIGKRNETTKAEMIGQLLGKMSTM